jgi:hypothetical protein
MSCAVVQPLSCATARSASTSCRFFGKFLEEARLEAMIAAARFVWPQRN